MQNVFFAALLFVIQQSLTAQTSLEFLTSVGIKDSLDSETLGETRYFYVQYPEFYNPNSTYPVAYILDGEMFLPLVSATHQFYSGGFFPEMILVGIANGQNRTRDLTPSVVTTKYGMPFNQETGGANNFLKYIEDELIKYVESKYPVTNYRTLIGHSYGGLFTIHTLVSRPELFANYLAIDPSLDWDDQIVIKKAAEIIGNKLYGNKSLYMSLGGQLHMQNPLVTIDNVMQDTTDFTKFARSNIAFENLVRQKSPMEMDWEFFKDDIHGTIAVPSIRNGLISLFEWFQMEKTDKFNSPDTPKEELYHIVKYRSSKLEKHFGYKVPAYPEELMNMSGYMSLQMGQFEKAKMFFEFGIEFFPESPNVYDSMADFYLEIEDSKKALEYLTKAYELSGENEYYKERIESIKHQNKK